MSTSSEMLPGGLHSTCNKTKQHVIWYVVLLHKHLFHIYKPQVSIQIQATNLSVLHGYLAHISSSQVLREDDIRYNDTVGVARVTHVDDLHDDARL